jgi:hypothetical protein
MNKKYLPYILFGIPIVIALILIKKATAQPKIDVTPTPDSGSDGGGSSGDTKPPTKKDDFPLKKGKRGSKVKELQRAILSYDKNLLPLYKDDGDFGSETEVALKSLIGKTTVDSQEDINAIINKRANDQKTADANAALELSNKQRKALASNLFTMWQKNKRLQWTALYDTIVTEADVTSDGREVNLVKKTYKRGDKIPKDKNAQGTHNEKGMITWFVDKKSYYISPWGFELK